MDTAFWHERWRSGDIPFHRPEVHPALARWWRACMPRADASVLVPLCGKSLDMRWLAERGHAVTGVEVEPTAVADFFREWGVEAAVDAGADGLVRHDGRGVRLVAGDFFAFAPERALDAVYDRAALVALPAALRPAYLRHLAACVAPGAGGLLISFEFVSRGYEGPPFAVGEAELRDQPWFAVECLERTAAGDTYRGLVERGASELHEVAYRLERTAAPGLEGG